MHTANMLMDRMCALLSAAAVLRIPWVVENPQSSIMWHDRALKSIARESAAVEVRLHMCAYESRWRKGTALWISQLPGAEQLARRCHATDHLCQHTGKAHIALRGRDEHGIPWTRRAQEYPSDFSDQVARLMHDAGLMLEFTSLARKTT